MTVWLVKTDGQIFGAAAWWGGKFETRAKAESLALALGNTYSKVEVEEVS